MVAETPVARRLSPIGRGAGKGPLHVRPPFEFPQNPIGNDRVETKRDGTIRPTDGSSQRGSSGRHRLGGPGAGPGVGHPHAVQRGGAAQAVAAKAAALRRAVGGANRAIAFRLDSVVAYQILRELEWSPDV